MQATLQAVHGTWGECAKQQGSAVRSNKLLSKKVLKRSEPLGYPSGSVDLKPIRRSLTALSLTSVSEKTIGRRSTF